MNNKDINKADKADEDTGRDESTMHTNIRTQITCDDLEVIQADVEGAVSEEEVEEAIVKINPDINSMDSRG